MSKGINRELGLPPEALALLATMGIQIPSNIKEITTETVESDTVRQITIPKGMDKLEASEELKKQWENEEQVIDFIAEFPEWNWKDVLVSIKKVTEETFGWMNAKSTMWTSPTEIDVVVDIQQGKKVTEKAFIGTFVVTTWDSAKVTVDITRSGMAYISLSAKRKHSKEITEYFNSLREHLRDNSIYKGRSIVVTEGQREGTLDFEIIEVKPSDKIFLNQDEDSVINTFVIGALGEEGKRTILFTGDYGNGKTEVAMKVGREAVIAHGMSFFYLKDAKLFDRVLNTLKQYSPAVLFVEDIDEIAGSQDRDEVMNKILNTLDGVQTKGNNITTIFTTNHIDRLNAAIRRPGRIDLIVKFHNPNRATITKIYESYFKDLPGYETLDMEAIVGRTPEAQGAVIAEIAKRVVRFCNSRGSIDTESVLACIVTMDYHVEVMSGNREDISKEKAFYESYQDMVEEAFNR